MNLDTVKNKTCKKVILEAKNIKKTFKTSDTLHLLNNLNLILHQNESIAIMGSSGIGKTTLLHILAGLESFDDGSIKILNEKKVSDKTRNEHIGFIFQTYNLLQDLTLLQNVLMPSYINRKSIKMGSDAYKRANLLLDELQLSKRKNYLTKDLSGGEKQRAAIARALANDPDIILADEPTGNLDYKNSKIMHNLLLDFVKKMKKSLIVATHDKELAFLCDKVFLIEDGTLKEISKNLIY